MHEIRRYLEKGFCMELDENELKRQFPTGTISKLALILKEKEDGSIKRRVIIDLLRSGGNSRCKIRERIVLPRVQDVVDSLKYLREQRFGVMLKAQKEDWPDQEQCQDIELVSADLADAYCHLAVAEKELGNGVTPSTSQGKYLVFTAMLFGFRGAPLIMGRFAATLARMLQALIPADEMQSQLYMDDPLWMLQGPKWRRQENLALILYMCGALGVNLQFKKGFRGTDAVWIGTRRELNLAEGVLILYERNQEGFGQLGEQGHGATERGTSSDRASELGVWHHHQGSMVCQHTLRRDSTDHERCEGGGRKGIEER
jgi:hypothetical protein